MGEQAYLEGCIPYSKEVIEEYVAKGHWENLTYGDYLDRAVAQSPEKVALIDDATQLTFAQFQEKVDRFAIALLNLDIKKHDRVLLQLPTRHEYLVAFHAMQRIGAIPVPAVTRNEYQEIAHVIKLTEPVAWIVPIKETFRNFLPLIDRVCSDETSLKHLIVLDDGEELPENALSMAKLIADVKLSDYPKDYLKQFRPDPNDIAVILTTGGTTGMPKGVPRTHNSFLGKVRCLQSDACCDDVLCVATPIGHTMANQGGVSGSIYLGATLVLVGVPRAKAILEAVQRHKVSRIAVVPTQLEDMLNDPDLEKYDLASLTQVTTAGAALKPDTAKKAADFFAKIGQRFGGGSFGSSEGPSAAHSPDEPPEVFSRSVGKPLSEGDHWKAIDEMEHEVPRNTEGELAAKGPSVFTGYYRSPAENRQAFTKDGYFKLGDLGKIDEEGYIYITGRKKDIIQRGGEGIVPGEIENLLCRHPLVEDSAVVAMPDPRLGERACAYVVLKDGHNLTLDKAVAFLKDLGAGMLLLPERLEIVPELPKTAVGKIDKKALRKDIEEKVRAEGIFKNKE